MIHNKSENKSNTRFLILLLFLGLVIRLLLPPLFIKGDLRTHFEWGKVLSEKGFQNSYDYTGWTTSALTQPPLILILCTVSHNLYETRYNLAVSHNTIGFPPGFVISWFDQYGESIVFCMWAIKADIVISLIIYFLIKKITNSFKLSLMGMMIYLFNPISLFISSIWGQSDLLSALFVLSAFYFFRFGYGKIISPLLFTLGLLIKPTAILLGPLYLFYIFRNIFKEKKLLKDFSLGIILSLVVALGLITVFTGISNHYFADIQNIINNRILPSAKGVARASVSAFNLYSVLFVIDRTLAKDNFLFLTINQVGIILSLIVYLISIYLFRKLKNFKTDFLVINLLIYLIIEGLFLFNSGMVERYFLLAFPPLIFLLVLIQNSRIKRLILIQNITWFINLFYSFFRRDFSEMAIFFQANNYLVIRLFSVINIIIYFLIIYLVLREISKQKNIRWNYQL